MAATTDALNLAASGVAASAVFVSLHTADPGSGGSSEATGGSPAYARKSVTWAAASNGERANSNVIVVDVPAATYTHFGLWSASSGGTFYGGQSLAQSVTFATQGTATWAVGGLKIKAQVPA